MGLTTFGSINPIPIFLLLIGIVYLIGFIIATLHSTKIALYLLFIVVTFGNFASEYLLIPNQINWLTEISILVLFVKSVLSKKSGQETGYKTFFSSPILLFFISITVTSILINGANPINSLLCLRLMFRYVVLFIALINLDLEESEIKQINKFVVFLVLFQFPVAFIRLFVYGQGEFAVGTYAGKHGGIQSTLLPLVVIPFAIGYYVLHKRSINYFFISMAFVGFSVIGGKKAFIFYLPVVLFYCIVIFRRDFLRYLTPKTLFLGAIFLFGSFWLTFNYVDRINPDKVGLYLHDSSKKGYGALWEYVVKYNLSESEDGVSHGRLSSTLKVFNLLNQKGFLAWVFGFGPGTFMKSRFVDKNSIIDIPVGYGKTEFNWTLYQFGIVATILYFMIVLRLLLLTKKLYPRIEEGYWKAFFFGLNAFSFVYILGGLSYSFTLTSHFLPCIYFYLSAVAVKKGRLYEN